MDDKWEVHSGVLLEAIQSNPFRSSPAQSGPDLTPDFAWCTNREISFRWEVCGPCTIQIPSHFVKGHLEGGPQKH